MPGNTRRLLLAIVCLCAAAPVVVAAESDESPQVRRLLSEGKSALDHRDYARACGTFQEALSLEPDSSWAKLYLQICEERRRAERPAVIEPSQVQERHRAERAEESATGQSRRAQEQAERRIRDRQEQERDRLEQRLEVERKAQERGRAQPKKRPAKKRAPAPEPPQPQPSSASEQPPAIATPPEPAPEPATEAPAPESSASLIPAIEEALPGEQPVVVHGDQVEFEPGTQKVIGVGHIRIDYHGLRLTADRVTVYLDSKDAFAEGHVVLTQADGVLTGELIYLNFETHKGTVLDVDVHTTPQDQSPPIYGKGRIAHKLSDQVLEIHQGYLTTCDYDPPHWRINSRRAEVHLGDKIVSQHNVLSVGRVRLLPLPNFSYSLKENRQQVSMVPGKHKQWGPFLLSAWRYEFNQDSKGTVHLDWRNNYGWAEGLDHRLRTDTLGDHLLRAYYLASTDRMDPATERSRLNRHRLQYRSRWDVDADTLITADVEKFSDKDFRRDFLFREEFENATTPDTYVSLVRTQPDYTFNALVRKRVNRFDAISERLPEVKLDLARRQVGETPLYYDSEISGGGYTNKRPSPTDSDDDVLRFDTLNELSYPFRWLGFLSFTPRASLRETFYSKDKQGDGSVSQPRLDGDRHILRTVWTTGVDFSTKFYRIFNVNTNALGLDVHGLRHVVTPSVAYTFSPEPPIHANLLQQFDGVDSLSRQNTVTFSLENKLQTKRTRPVRVFDAPTALTHEIDDRPTRRLGSSSLATTSSSVDLARLILSVPYQFIGSPDKGGRFNNVTADLEVQPSAWMRFESDLTYNTTLDKFSLWNFDWVVTPSDRWYAGWGHRFSREDKTESTVETGIRLSEKWWLGLFGRFTYKEVKPDGSGGFAKRFNNLRERQIVLSRDLHDWILEVTYRVDREFGEELYFTMRLKAFPDQPFEVKESYHQPKIGSQSSPFSPVPRQ